MDFLTVLKEHGVAGLTFALLLAIALIFSARVKDLERDISSLRERLATLEAHAITLTTLTQRSMGASANIDALNKRLTQGESRLTRLENRLLFRPGATGNVQ